TQEVIAMEAQTGPGGSADPERSQPRMFGGHLEPVRLPWKWAAERLTRARNYWIATTRPDGQPHSRPVWGIWLDDTFYFSTDSLAVQSMAANSAITVHLESGGEVVIIEGADDMGGESRVVARAVRLCGP